MPAFGLLHGAGLGAWCWERTSRELKARGHESAVVDLPLDDPSLGAAALAELVVEALGGIDDVILVAHSISGLIAPLAATRLRVKRLIFLHAALPRSGVSLVEQVRAEPDMFPPEMSAVPPSGWSDEATVTRFLFHDASPEDAREAFTRLRPSKRGDRVLVSEPSPIGDRPDVAVSYVVCRDDRTISPSWARKAVRERLKIEPVEIPGGHCPMISRPVELAETLVRLS